MNNPTIGRIVGYVLPEGHKRAGKVVPAIITRTWGAGDHVNLTPFVDVANDETVNPTSCCSVMHDGSATPKPRSWHWLPRE